MMKKTILASFAILAATSTGSLADTYYKGRIIYTTASPECGVNGPQVGNRDNAIYHPFKSTAPYSSLNIFWSYGSNGLRLDGRAFDSTARNVTDARSVSAVSYDPLANPNVVMTISAFEPSPSNPSPAPPTLILEGQIQNPYGDETLNACVVQYYFTGVRNN